MEAAPTYEEVLRVLTYRFQEAYPDDGSSVRLTGLLFARPGSPLSRGEVTPNLFYFHRRSGDHIDFFLAGYSNGDPVSDCVKVPEGPGGYWTFSNELFDSLRRKLEAETAWRYGGGTELVLANARYDAKEKAASLDFASCVVCQLDSMKECGAIESVETFFERIFRFAEGAQGTDPAWGFSDEQGKRVAGSTLRSLVLSLLPKEVAKDAKRAVHLAARDMTPERPGLLSRFKGLFND